MIMAPGWADGRMNAEAEMVKVLLESGKFCSRCLKINCMIKSAARAASSITTMQGRPHPPIVRAKLSSVGSPASWCFREAVRAADLITASKFSFVLG